MITAALKLPTLFYFGIDAAFGAFTTLVLFLAFMLSRKMWDISKIKRYKYFAWVFGGITLSFLSRTLTNLLLYFKYDEVVLNPASKSLIGFSNVFLIGYTIHILSGLGFYLLLLFVTMNVERWRLYFATLCLMLVGLFLSRSYFTSFYALAFVILVFVAGQYLMNYRKVRKLPSLLVFMVFLFLALAQAGFYAHTFGTIFYLLGYIFQAIGIFTLVIVLIKVIKNE